MFSALPHSAAAPLSLALPPSDYPKGTTIDPRPATNIQADRLLRPAHHSNFERLRRNDGEGWLQAALWYFKSGAGSVSERHQTIFGYGINVFRNRTLAEQALRDVKVKTHKFHVDHLPARIFASTDVKESLVFVFFHYRNIEVENYYEYLGVAPTATAKAIRHLFNRQSAHLSQYARKLHKALELNPPPPPSNTATATVTAIPSSTITATTGATPTLTATARPSATVTSSPTPSATATPTPSGFLAQATMGQPSYRPRDYAVVKVEITNDGLPVVGAQITATYFYPKSTATCSGITDSTGMATCSEEVPSLPDGTIINVEVHVAGPNGESAQTAASFTIRRTS